MATSVLLPKLGNTVESSIIVSWAKQVGDTVSEGDVICEVETDKATMEVESTESGTILALFFQEGDDVPVMTPIAAVGEPGEDFSDLAPDGAGAAAPAEAAPEPAPTSSNGASATAAPAPAPAVASPAPQGDDGKLFISPRARHLAERAEIDPANLTGSGPGGRIIERDVQAAIDAQPEMSPVARSMVASGDYTAPATGSGPGGRITKRDLIPVSGAAAPTAAAPAPAAAQPQPGTITEIPVKGMRKVISQRMLESVTTTAQLTFNSSADARALLAFRKRLKNSPEAMGLQKVTINDLIHLAVSRTLLDFPEVNATFDGETLYQYPNVNLGFAVDTPRGLIVPVIPFAETLSLKMLSDEARRLAQAANSGKITPDEMTGGTFTVTNLGNLGIESFTPILNPPQVGILGVDTISLKPVLVDDVVEHIPHIGFSLTVNHQIVDGAPAARFLQALSVSIAQLDLLMAL